MTGGRLATLSRRAAAFADARPFVAVALVAATVRIAFALASFLVHGAALVDDELNYIGLASTIADGGAPADWVDDWGDRLLSSTWLFTAPLSVLFDVFGTSRIVGQLYAAAGGVAVAVLTVVLARTILPVRWAVAAGLVVALLPSQVFWSSVVLRESLVWTFLALAAVGAARLFRGGRTDPIGLVLVAVGLLAVSLLRDQTFLAATYALVPAAVVAGGPDRWRRAALGVALVVVLPALAWLGPGGWWLLRAEVPTLGTTRAQMAAEAESAVTPTTDAPRDEGGEGVLVDSRGRAFVADDDIDANIRALPGGIVSTLIRPFPWDSTASTSGSLAVVENAAWIALYVAAALGTVRLWRHARHVLAYPTVVVGALVVASALSQGNLGTAFRHRGQILWALAVPAAGFAADALDRRRGARAALDDELLDTARTAAGRRT